MSTYLVAGLAVAFVAVYVAEVILMPRNMRRKIIKILQDSSKPLNTAEILQEITKSQNHFAVSTGTYYRSLDWLDRKAIIVSVSKLDLKKRSQSFYTLVEHHKTTSTP